MEHTDEVPVLIGDLDMIRVALANAAGLAATHALQQQFLQVRPRAKLSCPLVTQIEQALARVNGYLGEVKDDDDDVQ